MYRCLACGLVFTSPKEYETLLGECHGLPMVERFYACPYCVGDYIAIRRCAACGKMVGVEELDHDLCVSCRQAVWQQLRRMIIKEFGKAERRLIYDVLDMVEGGEDGLL